MSASERELLLLSELLETARVWLNFFRGRDYISCMRKAQEEMHEFMEAVQTGPLDEELDEFADVLVNVLRGFLAMSPREQRFVVMTVQDKTMRRVWGEGVTPQPLYAGGGVKDKKAETTARRQLAQTLELYR